MATKKRVKLRFVKMQGAGNDFVVIDNRQYGFSVEALAQMAPTLCNRRFGIGADGLMALNPDFTNVAQFEMIYRNADGSDAGMCGNGGRCMALFASSLGFGTRFSFHVHKVVYQAKVEPRKKFITLTFPVKPVIEKRVYGDFVEYYQLFTGTDHIVIPIINSDEFYQKNLIGLATELRNAQEVNPRGTNVNFYLSDEEKTTGQHSPIKLETFERGVEDFTLACGTGAIATALTQAFVQQKADKKWKQDIQCAGGLLHIGFEKQGNQFSDITLAGGAEIVFKGEVLIEG